MTRFPAREVFKDSGRVFETGYIRFCVLIGKLRGLKDKLVWSDLIGFEVSD